MSEIEEREIATAIGGVSENVLTATGQLDATKTHTELHLPGGQVLRLLTALLIQGAESAHPVTPTVAPDELIDTGPQIIPVLEEQIRIEKRTVVTGKVRLVKDVEEHAQILDVPLAMRSFDIERVALNQPVDTAPGVRQEGDTTIYPLVEEQLVLTTQLILREEVRVTRRDTERRDTRTVTLKREVMTITRENLTAPATDTASG